jgi:molybdate transport system ATP-binding protein
VIAFDIELVQGSFHLVAAAAIDSSTAALFGPSGSGKTTMLDVIAGLRTPQKGAITIDGRVLFSTTERIDVRPQQRRVGYLPQDVALFPHMNVRRNLLYGRHPGVSPDLDRVVTMLEIAPLLDRRVTDLSGGERQRVALGRALMSGPSLLLLDEPLAAVDVPLRRRIIPYLQRIRDDLAIPIVYVSHDRDEVRQLADFVLLLENGAVIAAGPPDKILPP